jgi:hypothetical protein
VKRDLQYVLARHRQNIRKPSGQHRSTSMGSRTAILKPGASRRRFVGKSSGKHRDTIIAWLLIPMQFSDLVKGEKHDEKACGDEPCSRCHRFRTRGARSPD